MARVPRKRKDTRFLPWRWSSRRRWLATAALVMVLSAVHGFIWWTITPPWTAPDEPGHYLYARLMADLGRVPQRANLTPAVEMPVLDSLLSSGWWAYDRRSPPAEPLARLESDATLAASGIQIQEEPPLYYILPAWWLRHFAPADPAQALHWLRLWSLGLRMLAVAAALALAYTLRPDRPAWGAALGLLVGALPMVGFIGGSFNNTTLALTWGAVLFLLLTLPAKSHWRFLVLLLALCAPFLVDSNLLYLWPLILLWAGAKALQRWQRRKRILFALLLPVLLLLPHPRWASGWELTVLGGPSRDGELGLLLVDTWQDRQTALSQMFSGKSFLPMRGQTLVLDVAYWGSMGAQLGIRLDDGRSNVVATCQTQGRDEMGRCQVQLRIHPNANLARVRLSVGSPGEENATGTLHAQPRLLDPAGRDLLFNSNALLPAALVSPLFPALERRLPIPRGYFAQTLAPEAWDAPAQFRYLLFAGFTWASFWGYFGWLSRPFPWPVYIALAGLTLLAGWGLLQKALQLLRRRRHLSHEDQVMLLAGLASLLILAQVWLPMIGQNWQPQGRYLFSALLPLALLHLTGWEQALPARWRPFLPGFLFLLLFILNWIAWNIVRW